MVFIDGHGVGVWGCAHPPKNLKSPDTPHGVGPGAKK